MSLFRPLLFALCLLVAAPALAQDIKAELEEAAKLHQAGKLDQAIQIYSKALAPEAKLEPAQRAGVLLMRGRALYQKRDTKGAAADYEQAIELVPDNALAYLSRGALKVELKDYVAALPDFDRVLAIRPDFLPAVVARARILGELRRYDDAAETWGRVVAMNPKDPTALHQRGVAYSAAGDRVRALRDFDAALTMVPDRPEILLDRAALRTNAGDYADARADAERAILVAPTEGAPYRLRGRIRFEQGEYAGAVTDFTTADAADGLRSRRDAYVVLWLHMAKLRAGTADTADLQKRLDGIDLAIWPGPIARHYLGQMDIEAVIVAAQATPEAVLRNEQLCEAYFYLAQSEIAAGRIEEGTALLRKALATDAIWFIEWNAARAELARLGK